MNKKEIIFNKNIFKWFIYILLISFISVIAVQHFGSFQSGTYIEPEYDTQLYREIFSQDKFVYFSSPFGYKYNYKIGLSFERDQFYIQNGRFPEPPYFTKLWIYVKSSFQHWIIFIYFLILICTIFLFFRYFKIKLV